MLAVRELSRFFAEEAVYVSHADLPIEGFAYAGFRRYRTARPPLPELIEPDTLVLSYLVRGQQVLSVADAYYQLRGGDVLVALPGERRSSAGRPAERCLLLYVAVRLSRGQTRFLAADPNEAPGLVQRLFSLPRRLLRSTPSLRRDFEQAVYSAATPGELRRSRFLAAATSLFLSLVERSGSAKPRTRLSSLLAWLEAHPDTQASVAELARRMGLSAPRLHAIFREEMGMAPHEYLLRLKVRRGAEMLAHSDHSVTRIAHELGFLSSQYFSTVFRRYEGMTPSDWRKASLSAAAPE